MTIENTKKDKPTSSVQALQSMVYNKMLPHSVEFEKEVLGVLTLEADAIYTVLDILSPDDFYSQIHQHIYKAILTLFDQSHQPSIIMVAEQLRKMGVLEEVGGPAYLVECERKVVSSANFEAHCRIILQKSIKRKTINLCAETIFRMYQDENDVFDVLDHHNEKLFVNTSGILVRQNLTMAAVGAKFLKEIETSWTQGMTGVPTGIPKIDKETNGLQPGTLTLLAARTRHGKSAIAAAMMHHCSKIINPDYPATSKNKSKYPAAFLSIEMQDTEVFARLVSAELAEMGYYIPYSRFKGGKSSLTEQDLTLINLAVERLASRGMYIDDTADLNQFTLKARIMKLIMLYGVKIVFIDYAQLMSNAAANKSSNTADNLSVIAKTCKVLSKFFNIPIVLLSQIDRDTEKKEPRPPVIADLKGSGTLEESADYILLVWRPEVWDVNAVNIETQVSERGIMYVNLAKHKQGEVNKARIPFDVATNSYGDMSLVDEYDTIKTYIENHPKAKF